MENTAQALVDALVCEHGEYDPLALLVEQGRLDPDDLERWRSGELARLDDALIGNAARILDLLEAAARWAASLGLEPVAGPGGARAASDPRLDRALRTRHVRTEPEGQLDLFLDAAEASALAALREALRALDADAAADRLADLAARSPGHPLLPAAERLCDALPDLAAGEALVEPEAELEILRDALAADARALLGARAGALLEPFWRRLARRLGERPFDPARPDLHAAAAFAACEAWGDARDAVLATPEFDREPALLALLAEAELRSGRRAEAIARLATLCWRFPDRAEAQVEGEGFPDAGVRSAWEALQDEDEDEDPAPGDGPIAWLPAWLLLAEPGLARSEGLAAALAGPGSRGAPAEAFAALRDLLARPARDLGEEAIALRARLRDASPLLLERYLERRAG